MQNKINPNCCDCGGEVVDCEVCNDDFAATSGIYTAGQTIPGTCGLAVSGGIVTAGSGAITIATNATVTANPAITPHEKRYVAVRANFTNTNRMVLKFTAGPTFTLEVKTNNRFYATLTANNGLTDGTYAYDFGQGSYSSTVNDLLVEMCFREVAANKWIVAVAVPFLNWSYSMPSQSIGGGAFSVKAENRSLTVTSVEQSLHIQEFGECVECSDYEANNSGCTLCTDGFPLTVQVTMPTLTQVLTGTAVNCSGQNSDCAEVAGTWRLSATFAENAGADFCYWKVNAPQLCYVPGYDAPPGSVWSPSWGTMLFRVMAPYGFQTPYTPYGIVELRSEGFQRIPGGFSAYQKGGFDNIWSAVLPVNPGNRPIICKGRTLTLPHGNIAGLAQPGPTLGQPGNACTGAGTTVTVRI